jgi:D-alanyl-D-alanine carboxypeptidase/D-alanyl-D-alanine-endopeptidase (penicillin-binding protein 4)
LIVPADQPFKSPYPVEIARRESPPFSEIAVQTLKPSQNLYTELILRTLGKQYPAADPKLTSAEAGLSVIRTFLNEAGVNTAHLAFVDGSGLARQNLITAESTVQLLTYMSKHRHASAWRDAQPVAGVDGTLRSRMRNTAAAGNLRAKTGTLNNVNHYPDDNSPRQNYMDAIAVLLASFAAKSD